MTEIPEEAIDAACDVLAETGSAVAAIKAAAPHIAAAERKRILEIASRETVGYLIGGKVHHPADVTIIRKGMP